MASEPASPAGAAPRPVIIKLVLRRSAPPLPPMIGAASGPFINTIVPAGGSSTPINSPPNSDAAPGPSISPIVPTGGLSTSLSSPADLDAAPRRSINTIVPKGGSFDSTNSQAVAPAPNLAMYDFVPRPQPQPNAAAEVPGPTSETDNFIPALNLVANSTAEDIAPAQQLSAKAREALTNLEHALRQWELPRHVYGTFEQRLDRFLEQHAVHIGRYEDTAPCHYTVAFRRMVERENKEELENWKCPIDQINWKNAGAEGPVHDCGHKHKPPKGKTSGVEDKWARSLLDHFKRQHPHAYFDRDLRGMDRNSKIDSLCSIFSRGRYWSYPPQIDGQIIRVFDCLIKYDNAVRGGRNCVKSKNIPKRNLKAWGEKRKRSPESVAEEEEELEEELADEMEEEGETSERAEEEVEDESPTAAPMNSSRTQTAGRGKMPTRSTMSLRGRNLAAEDGERPAKRQRRDPSVEDITNPLGNEAQQSRNREKTALMSQVDFRKKLEALEKEFKAKMALKRGCRRKALDLDEQLQHLAAEIATMKEQLARTKETVANHGMIKVEPGLFEHPAPEHVPQTQEEIAAQEPL